MAVPSSLLCGMNEIKSIRKVVFNHHISESVCKLYLDESSADVYFVFHNEIDETIERIPAHRLILGAASSVFHRMFYGELKEEGDVLIADTTKDAFAEFLQFFYSDEVTLTTKHIVDVYQLTHKYGLPKSTDICNDFLIECLNYDTLPLTMQIALWYENQKLLNICERMVCDHADKVFENDAFLGSGKQVTKHILSMASLNCSETDLLDAYMKWAKRECQRTNILNPTIAQRLNVLENVRNLIRFRSMSYEEFTLCIAKYPNMFMAEELQDILSFIGKIGGNIDRNKRKRFSSDRIGIIRCSRVVNHQSKLHVADRRQCARFFTNEEIFLCGIVIGKRTIVPECVQRTLHASFVVSVHNSSNSFNWLLQRVNIDLNEETEIHFNKTVRIVPSKIYDITFELDSDDEPIYSTIELNTNSIKIGNKTQITFMNRFPKLPNEDHISRGLITDILFRYDTTEGS